MILMARLEGCGVLECCPVEVQLIENEGSHILVCDYVPLTYRHATVLAGMWACVWAGMWECVWAGMWEYMWVGECVWVYDAIMFSVTYISSLWCDGIPLRYADQIAIPLQRLGCDGLCFCCIIEYWFNLYFKMVVDNLFPLKNNNYTLYLS